MASSIGSNSNPNSYTNSIYFEKEERKKEVLPPLSVPQTHHPLPPQIEANTTPGLSVEVSAGIVESPDFYISSFLFESGESRPEKFEETEFIEWANREGKLKKFMEYLDSLPLKPSLGYLFFVHPENLDRLTPVELRAIVRRTLTIEPESLIPLLNNPKIREKILSQKIFTPNEVYDLIASILQDDYSEEALFDFLSSCMATIPMSIMGLIPFLKNKMEAGKEEKDPITSSVARAMFIWSISFGKKSDWPDFFISHLDFFDQSNIDQAFLESARANNLARGFKRLVENLHKISPAAIEEAFLLFIDQKNVQGFYSLLLKWDLLSPDVRLAGLEKAIEKNQIEIIRPLLSRMIQEYNEEQLEKAILKSFEVGNIEVIKSWAYKPAIGFKALKIASEKSKIEFARILSAQLFELIVHQDLSRFIRDSLDNEELLPIWCYYPNFTQIALNFAISLKKTEVLLKLLPLLVEKIKKKHLTKLVLDPPLRTALKHGKEEVMQCFLSERSIAIRALEIAVEEKKTNWIAFFVSHLIKQSEPSVLKKAILKAIRTKDVAIFRIFSPLFTDSYVERWNKDKLCEVLKTLPLFLKVGYRDKKFSVKELAHFFSLMQQFFSDEEMVHSLKRFDLSDKGLIRFKKYQDIEEQKRIRAATIKAQGSKQQKEALSTHLKAAKSKKTRDISSHPTREGLRRDSQSSSSEEEEEEDLLGGGARATSFEEGLVADPQAQLLASRGSLTINSQEKKEENIISPPPQGATFEENSLSISSEIKETESPVAQTDATIELKTDPLKTEREEGNELISTFSSPSSQIQKSPSHPRLSYQDNLSVKSHLAKVGERRNSFPLSFLKEGAPPFTIPTALAVSTGKSISQVNAEQEEEANFLSIEETSPLLAQTDATVALKNGSLESKQEEINLSDKGVEEKGISQVHVEQEEEADLLSAEETPPLPAQTDAMVALKSGPLEDKQEEIQLTSLSSFPSSKIKKSSSHSQLFYQDTLSHKSHLAKVGERRSSLPPSFQKGVLPFSTPLSLAAHREQSVLKANDEQAEATNLLPATDEGASSNEVLSSFPTPTTPWPGTIQYDTERKEAGKFDEEAFLEEVEAEGAHLDTLIHLLMEGGEKNFSSSVCHSLGELLQSAVRKEDFVRISQLAGLSDKIPESAILEALSFGITHGNSHLVRALLPFLGKVSLEGLKQIIKKAIEMGEISEENEDVLETIESLLPYLEKFKDESFFNKSGKLLGILFERAIQANNMEAVQSLFPFLERIPSITLYRLMELLFIPIQEKVLDYKEMIEFFVSKISQMSSPPLGAFLTAGLKGKDKAITSLVITWQEKLSVHDRGCLLKAAVEKESVDTLPWILSEGIGREDFIEVFHKVVEKNHLPMIKILVTSVAELYVADLSPEFDTALDVAFNAVFKQEMALTQKEPLSIVSEQKSDDRSTPQSNTTAEQRRGSLFNMGGIQLFVPYLGRISSISLYPVFKRLWKDGDPSTIAFFQAHLSRPISAGLGSFLIAQVETRGEESQKNMNEYFHVLSTPDKGKILQIIMKENYKTLFPIVIPNLPTISDQDLIEAIHIGNQNGHVSLICDLITHSSSFSNLLSTSRFSFLDQKFHVSLQQTFHLAVEKIDLRTIQTLFPYLTTLPKASFETELRFVFSQYSTNEKLIETILFLLSAETLNALSSEKLGSLLLAGLKEKVEAIVHLLPHYLNRLRKEELIPIFNELVKIKNGVAVHQALSLLAKMEIQEDDRDLASSFGSLLSWSVDTQNVEWLRLLIPFFNRIPPLYFSSSFEVLTNYLDKENFVEIFKILIKKEDLKSILSDPALRRIVEKLTEKREQILIAQVFIKLEQVAKCRELLHSLKTEGKEEIETLFTTAVDQGNTAILGLFLLEEIFDLETIYAFYKKGFEQACKRENLSIIKVLLTFPFPNQEREFYSEQSVIFPVLELIVLKEDTDAFELLVHYIPAEFFSYFIKEIVQAYSLLYFSPSSLKLKDAKKLEDANVPQLLLKKLKTLKDANQFFKHAIKDKNKNEIINKNFELAKIFFEYFKVSVEKKHSSEETQTLGALFLFCLEQDYLDLIASVFPFICRWIDDQVLEESVREAIAKKSVQLLVLLLPAIANKKTFHAKRLKDSLHEAIRNGDEVSVTLLCEYFLRRFPKEDVAEGIKLANERKAYSLVDILKPPSIREEEKKKK